MKTRMKPMQELKDDPVDWSGFDVMKFFDAIARVYADRGIELKFRVRPREVAPEETVSPGEELKV